MRPRARLPIDITAYVETAIHVSNPLRAEEIAREIGAANPEARVDCDMAAGERWIRFVEDARVVGMVMCDFPLGFIAVAAKGSREGLIELEDFDVACLSIEGDVLERLCGRRVDGSTVNLGAMSANDLFALSAT